MSEPTPTAAALVASFAEAGPDRLDGEFRRLAGALWNDGAATAAALPAVPGIVAAFGEADDAHAGYLAVLLGLLAEADSPGFGGELTAAIAQGTGGYLERLAGCAKGDPLALALLYLLAHLPQERDRVLAAVAGLDIDPDDRTRLERCLEPLVHETAVLGRCWPSPWEWALTERERAFDRGWIDALPREQVTEGWNADTQSVLAYSGAKAYWAVQHGRPTLVEDTSPRREPPSGAPAELPPAAFAHHGTELRCPNCSSKLTFEASVRCDGCSTTYPLSGGIADFTVAAGSAHSDDDVLQGAAAMEGIGTWYEAVLRPAFLRVMGTNWGGDVSPADEDDYIRQELAGAEGPVLDLAAGAGRWTEIVAEAVGTERLIALDVLAPMLAGMRTRLPSVPAVLASALNLPFEDASLGAVNCWNALQAIPDPGKAVAEIGRVLRPGGVFTLLTFRWPEDRINRYFQHAHIMPGSPKGIELFELELIKTWLKDAGLVIRTERTPGSFVFVTAERVA
ncbi:class I SAM-dependent methyltransferase [Amycolatopsis sp. NPDC004747]